MCILLNVQKMRKLETAEVDREMKQRERLRGSKETTLPTSNSNILFPTMLNKMTSNCT